MLAFSLPFLFDFVCIFAIKCFTFLENASFLYLTVCFEGMIAQEIIKLLVYRRGFRPIRLLRYCQSLKVYVCQIWLSKAAVSGRCLELELLVYM